MKAWLVKDKEEFSATVVFAETRGKAKSVAMYTEACGGVAFCDIETHTGCRKWINITKRVRQRWIGMIVTTDSPLSKSVVFTVYILKRACVRIVPHTSGAKDTPDRKERGNNG